MPAVDDEKEGRLGRITLNRPEVLNVIDDELPRAVSVAVAQADDAFCAGYARTFYAEGNATGDVTRRCHRI